MMTVNNKSKLIANGILFNITSNKLFKERIKAGSKEHITDYINEPFQIDLRLNGITNQVNILPLSYYILLSGLDEYGKQILHDYINILLNDFDDEGYGANIRLNLGELSPINALRINYKLGGNSKGILTLLSSNFNKKIGSNFKNIIIPEKFQYTLNNYNPQLIAFEKKFGIHNLSKSKLKNVYINPAFNISSASAGGSKLNKNSRKCPNLPAKNFKLKTKKKGLDKKMWIVSKRSDGIKFWKRHQ